MKDFTKVIARNTLNIVDPTDGQLDDGLVFQSIYSSALGNGFWNLTSAQIVILSQELKAIVDAAGITLNPLDNGQVLTSLIKAINLGGHYVDSGVADAYVLNTVPTGLASQSYVTGMFVRFRPLNANTGACTVNVCGLGVKNIKSTDGSTTLQAGEISPDFDCVLIYDGTSFRISKATVLYPTSITDSVGNKVYEKYSSNIDSKIAQIPLIAHSLGLTYRDRRHYEKIATGFPSSIPLVSIGGGFIWCSGGSTIYKVKISDYSIVSSFPFGTITSETAFDGTYLWITIYSTGAGTTVKKMDITTGTIVNTITVGTAPQGIAFDGRFMWVANRVSNNVSKIDTTTDTVVSTVSVGTTPTSACFDGKYIYITNSISNNVSKIDTTTDTVVSTIPVGTTPLYGAFNGEAIYISNSMSNSVSKIDIYSGTVVSTITGFNFPRGIAFDGNDIFVTNTTGNSISKVDTRSNNIISTFSCTNAPNFACFDGVNVCVSTNGNYLLAINR